MYKDLSFKDRAKVIREGVRLGLTSIDDILNLYDEAINYLQGGPIVTPYDNYIPDNNGYRNDPNVITGNKYLILDFEGRGYVPLVGDMNKPIGYFSNAGERGVLYPGELKNVLGSMVYEHPLIGHLALEGKKFNRQKISDNEYFSIMEKVALENNAKWNKERKEKKQRQLSVDEELVRLLNSNDYDYRGYYTKYPNSKANADTHWTDEFKTIYHPTFSNESRYSGIIDRNYNPYGYIGGSWENDDKFIPAPWLLDNQYQLGGLTKPFSYGDIPDVRYLKGGNIFLNGEIINRIKPIEEYITPIEPPVLDNTYIVRNYPYYLLPEVLDRNKRLSDEEVSNYYASNILWTMENPKHKGLNSDGTYSAYEDEAGFNFGPGLHAKSNNLDTNKTYTKLELDSIASNIALNYMKLISEDLETMQDGRYAGARDTLSAGPLLTMLDIAYNVKPKNKGNMPLKWPNLTDSLINGNIEKAKENTYSGSTRRQKMRNQMIVYKPLEGITVHNEALGGNLFKKGGIYIKPENRGKFTALKKRTGHSASWFKAHGTPALKKMATFALNARHWKHDEGGHLFLEDGWMNTNLLTLFDKYGPKSQVIQIDKPVRLNEVLIVADAPKPGDINYDGYIANTYDAWKRGDVDINTLPTETRNRVRGYSGTIAALKGMNDAAKVAGMTVAVPTAIIAGINGAIYGAPYFLKGMDYVANPLTTLSKGFKLNPNIQYFAQLGDKALDFIGAEVGLANGGHDLMNGKVGKGLTEVGLSAIPFVSNARLFNKAYSMLDDISLLKYIDKAVKAYDDDYYNVLKTEQLGNTPIEFITRPNNPHFGKFKNMGKSVAGKADKSTETFWLPYPRNSKFKGFVYAGMDNQKMLENYIDKKVDPLAIYHEIRHLYQPKTGAKTRVPLGVYNDDIGYYVANQNHPLYNTSLHLLNKNIKSGSVNGLSNSWAASPRELDALVAAFKLKNNITKRFVDLDPNDTKKWELLDFISKDFGDVNDVYKIMNEMSKFGYFKNGGLIKSFNYTDIPVMRYGFGGYSYI